jgi:HD-GYP domain-containing protein (c-di-GMP phosphodiesterase class II)
MAISSIPIVTFVTLTSQEPKVKPKEWEQNEKHIFEQASTRIDNHVLHLLLQSWISIKPPTPRIFLYAIVI